MKLPEIRFSKLITCSSSSAMRALKRHKKLDVYNRIEVSGRALLDNADFFRRKTDLQIIPVVKSNAYGHGIELVAKALKPGNFPFLAVDGYFEAQKIRKITKAPILVMGMVKPGDFKKLNTKNIIFAVQDEATINALGTLKRKVKIHLDINTGMNRYGISPDELDIHLSTIKKYPKLELAGVMTHLADPDSKDEKNIIATTKLFDDIVSRILNKGFKPQTIHIGQSASSVRIRSKYANATRIGLSLYGINPFQSGHELHTEFKNNLKPALQLISTISKINNLETGDGVSYNYTFRASKPMSIGVLPLGYYEGVDYRLGNKGSLKLGSEYLPIAGKVCMNHTMLDLGGSNARVGDEVIVFSSDPQDKNSFNNLAEQHGLFVYSMLSGLSPDVRRVLV